MPAPSSFMVSGVFRLSHGRASTGKPYQTYVSTIGFINPQDSVRVSVRKHAGEPVWPDGTVVFMVARAQLVLDGSRRLDAVHCVSFGPTLTAIPPGIHAHVAFLAGIVVANGGDGPARWFTLSVSEYVHGMRFRFLVGCVSVVTPWPDSR